MDQYSTGGFENRLWAFRVKPFRCWGACSRSQKKCIYDRRVISNLTSFHVVCVGLLLPQFSNITLHFDIPLHFHTVI